MHHVLVKIWLIAIILSLCACVANVPAPVSVPRGYLDDVPKVYEVQQGDTLFSIAWRYGLDSKEIARNNHLNQRAVIHSGQKLVLSVTEKKANTRSKAVQKSPSGADKPAQKPTPKSKAIVWLWPVKGKLLPTSRHYPNALMISGQAGQKIRAAAGGKVVYKGSGLRGYGKLIIIKHNKYYLSAYAHNRKLLVEEGDTVQAGQVIAEMGSSNNAKPALHFEIRKNGKPVKPLPLLPQQ